MLMNTVLKDIKTLVNSSIIKIESMAKKFETLETIENADKYIAAVQQTDRFNMYTTFDIDAVINANITTNVDLQLQYANEPSTIPAQFRDRILNEQRKIIIDNYIEINNYYRMLNGLPDIEESEDDFIKLTEEQRIANGILVDDYIHLLSINDIYKLEESGTINQLISKYPDKKYLNHLGINKIDFVTARITNNFGILSLTSNDVPDEFYNTFLNIYNQNREYFMTVIYIQNYGNTYKLYDNFIGLCIMLMTIQRVICNTFKFGIQREFYDWTFVQNMYKAYNVPFIESLPLEYHVLLLKNLNNLLRYKSTDKVLFDIASLLGYDRLKIFKYYLVKEHKLDNDEKPLFYYTQKYNDSGEPEVDENGNPVYEEDVERMYDIYFQKVNLKENNLTLALQDKTNRLEYKEVILDDPYWWEDNELNSMMYKEAYNYVETKYISLNLMYKMTEMLFEVSYAFRMLIDKKSDISEYTLSIPKIYTETNFKIFDIVIFMIALLCKQHGFKDGIITTPSMISHIYGFNFNEETIEYIKQIIIDNPKIIDQKLLDYFNDLTFDSADDVNDMFTRIRDYNNFIIDKMRDATSIEAYNLYKKIFTVSMISETQTDMFTINTFDENGNPTTKVATTYLEYLKAESPILAEIVTTTEVQDIPSMLEHITSQINDFMTSMQYLFIVTDVTNPVFKALSSLMKFFKSYTVDLNSFSIIYLFDSKYYNMFKMIEDIKMVNGYIYPEGNINYLYSDDYYDIISNLRTPDDVLKFNDYYRLYMNIHLDDEYVMYDKIKSISNGLYLNDEQVTEELAHLIVEKGYYSVLKILDKALNHAKITKIEQEKLIDKINKINSNIRYDGTLDHQYATDLLISGIDIYKNEKSNFKDMIIIKYDE